MIVQSGVMRNPALLELFAVVGATSLRARSFSERLFDSLIVGAEAIFFLDALCCCF